MALHAACLSTVSLLSAASQWIPGAKGGGSHPIMASMGSRLIPYPIFKKVRARVITVRGYWVYGSSLLLYNCSTCTSFFFIFFLFLHAAIDALFATHK